MINRLFRGHSWHNWISVFYRDSHMGQQAVANDRGAAPASAQVNELPFRTNKTQSLCRVFLMGFCLIESSALAQVAPPLPPIFDPTGRSGEPPAPLRKEFK